MTLSELCARSGVSAATVKYYLREGLLAPGARVSATRAEYSPAHLDRLRLIRALVQGAGVSIEGARRVVHAIEHPPASRHDLLGVAQHAIDGPPPDVPVVAETRQAVERLGWRNCAPGRLAYLQAALDVARRAGFPVTSERLEAYGRAMAVVATHDLDALTADPDAATASGALKHVAVGTVVTDPVLVALRRLAQEYESHARFADASDERSPTTVRT